MSVLRPLTLFGAALAFSTAHGQYVAMSFSDTNDANNFYSTAASFDNGVFSAGTLILGDNVTAAGLYSHSAIDPFAIDLSAYQGGNITLASSLNAGNEANGFGVILNFADTDATDYLYYYTVSAAELSTSGITTVKVGDIGTPDYVLDANAGYAFVGAGAAFAPTTAQLSQTKQIYIQGQDFDASKQLRATLDQVTINAVPEPATIAVLGLGLATFTRRRRSRA